MLDTVKDLAGDVIEFVEDAFLTTGDEIESIVEKAKKATVGAYVREADMESLTPSMVAEGPMYSPSIVGAYVREADMESLTPSMVAEGPMHSPSIVGGEDDYDIGERKVRELNQVFGALKRPAKFEAAVEALYSDYERTKMPWGMHWIKKDEMKALGIRADVLTQQILEETKSAQVVGFETILGSFFEDMDPNLRTAFEVMLPGIGSIIVAIDRLVEGTSQAADDASSAADDAAASAPVPWTPGTQYAAGDVVSSGGNLFSNDGGDGVSGSFPPMPNQTNDGGIQWTFQGVDPAEMQPDYSSAAPASAPTPFDSPDADAQQQFQQPQIPFGGNVVRPSLPAASSPVSDLLSNLTNALNSTLSTADASLDDGGFGGFSGSSDPFAAMNQANSPEDDTVVGAVRRGAARRGQKLPPAQAAKRALVAGKKALAASKKLKAAAQKGHSAAKDLGKNLKKSGHDARHAEHFHAHADKAVLVAKKAELDGQRAMKAAKRAAAYAKKLANRAKASGKQHTVHGEHIGDVSALLDLIPGFSLITNLGPAALSTIATLNRSTAQVPGRVLQKVPGLLAAATGTTPVEVTGEVLEECGRHVLVHPRVQPLVPGAMAYPTAEVNDGSEEPSVPDIFSPPPSERLPVFQQELRSAQDNLPEPITFRVDTPESYSQFSVDHGLHEESPNYQVDCLLPEGVRENVRTWRSGDHLFASMSVANKAGGHRIVTGSIPLDRCKADVIGAYAQSGDMETLSPALSPAADMYYPAIVGAAEILGIAETHGVSEIIRSLASNLPSILEQDPTQFPGFGMLASALPPPVAALVSTLNRAGQGDPLAQQDIATIEFSQDVDMMGYLAEARSLC